MPEIKPGDFITLDGMTLDGMTLGVATNTPTNQSHIYRPNFSSGQYLPLLSAEGVVADIRARIEHAKATGGALSIDITQATKSWENLVEGFDNLIERQNTLEEIVKIQKEEILKLRKETK